MITTTDIKLGALYFNGEICADPIIEYIGSENIAVKCIDNTTGTYRVQSLDGQTLPGSLTFIVRCGECSDCPPKVITRTLCSVDNPCTGPCEDCVGGICVSRCKENESCINGQCRSCLENSDCPCNQICTATGCACPSGTTLNPLNKCCDACQSSEDCGPCSDCVNINGANVCVARDCGDGVCDPQTDRCVQCLTSGDCANKSCKYCDPVLKRCVAGEGQVQIGNDCVPAPDCTTDVDCNDPCLTCGPAGKCVPIQCPPGKTPARIGNTCECVEECDCEDPGSCSDPTKYCTAVSPETCGCLSCKGNCADGCEEPCICDPLLNKCVANTCNEVTCTDGTECGPGCGCDNGKCVPCSTLSCTDSSCAQVLGCKCAGLSCVADDCGNAPCTTSFDCPIGCTCDDGKCTGCSNFACSPIDNCSQQVGCECVGGKCKGDDDRSCDDTLALIKNDDDCSLTGSLTTENCCQCSPLTLAIKGKRTTSTATEYKVVFQTELRKGPFNGVNVNENPLLDDLTNDNIGENEVPTTGTITYQAYTTYAIYKNFGSGYVFTGNSVEGPKTGLASYIGGAATVKFPEAAFKKIGITEQVDENTQREAVEVEIEFLQSSHLVVPNNCNYRSPKTIGKYTITSDDDWMAFSTVNANNGIATTVTSTACRDPFFVWRKDGEIFRKLYVDGTNNTYSDLLERPPVDELESCSVYSLEVDCSCEKSISDTVVFCNPKDILFNISNCGKSFELLDFETCTPNNDIEFFIKGGDLNITFTGDNPPINQIYTSTKCIDKLTYGMSCAPDCTKTYYNTCSEFEIDYETECDPDGSKFTVTFDSTVTDQSGKVYNVDKIEVSGFTLTPGTGFQVKLNWGLHTAKIYPAGGCDFFEETVEENCCTSLIPSISRDCDGVTNCTHDPTVTYTVNGVIQTDICAFVDSLPDDQSATIIITKGTCPQRSIVIPSLGSQCCENFDFAIKTVTDTSVLVEAYSAGDGATLNVTGAGVVITQQAPGIWLVAKLVPGNTYVFTVNSIICGSLSKTKTISVCDLNLRITQPSAPNCDSLTAAVTYQKCDCKVGEWRIKPTNVDASFLKKVEFDIESVIQGFDAGIETGEVVFIDHLGTETALGCTTCVKTVSFPKPGDHFCLEGVFIRFELLDDWDAEGNQSMYVTVFKGGTADANNIVDDPNISSTAVTINGTKVTTPDATIKQFIFANCCMENQLLQVELEIAGTDGKIYYGNTSINSVTTVTPVDLAVTDVCTNAPSVSELGLRVELRNLVLKDACEYAVVGKNFTYLVGSETVVPATTQTVPLNATNPEDRKVKFVWKEDGAQILTQWSYATATLGSAYLEQGKTYSVNAYCDPCDDYAEKEFCCIPVISFIDNGLASFDISITGLPGTYSLDVEGTVYPITIGGSGVSTETVTYNGPLTPEYDYSVDLTIPGTTCATSTTYTSPEEVTPILSFSPCNPATGYYSIQITNATPTWATTIISGSGAVDSNGVDIIQAEETNPPVFYVESRGVTSGSIVGTSPTSCYSSSTAFTSSSINASSSGPVSSSIPASSSAPASSSGTSSVTISSSQPASSSVVMSSSGPNSSSAMMSSAQAPSSSGFFSSSNAMGSSSFLSSSNAMASSSANPIPSSSAAGVAPTCNTTLNIVSAPESCTYTLQGANPNTGSITTPQYVENDNNFDALTFTVACKLSSNCEGQISLTNPQSADYSLVGYKNLVDLQSGDEAGIVGLYDGTSWFTIDISPTGYLPACGEFQVVSPSNLTYTGSNGTAFATAIYQAMVVRLCNLGYVEGVDYSLRVQYNAGDLKIALRNKINPTSLLWYRDENLNGSPTNQNDAIIRSGTGIATSEVFSVLPSDIGWLDLWDFSAVSFDCNVSSVCGSLSSQNFLNFSGNSAAYGAYTLLSGPTITGGFDSNSCSHTELVATLTGAECTPAYMWSGPGTINNPTSQTIYVTTSGTYEVDVTGCPGCGTLEDSETV